VSGSLIEVFHHEISPKSIHKFHQSYPAQRLFLQSFDTADWVTSRAKKSRTNDPERFFTREDEDGHTWSNLWKNSPAKQKTKSFMGAVLVAYTQIK